MPGRLATWRLVAMLSPMDWGCFNAIKHAGHDHNVIITGGGPESVKIPEFDWVNTILGNVKNALHGTFHAISERHFHRYLAEFCYRFNRRFDLRDDSAILLCGREDSTSAFAYHKVG